jgi:nicotinamide-nucleotide amidase
MIKMNDNILSKKEEILPLESINNTDIEFIIGELLIKNRLTIATAESCTGGMVAAKLINYPGISEVFLEGAVTYSNEAKMNRLGVRKETLDSFGAVSSETASEMAQGIAKTAGTDIGLSTTGIAGPGGGTQQKPVGLVFIGLYIKGRVITRELRLTGERQNIRNIATIEVLDWLKDELINF